MKHTNILHCIILHYKFLFLFRYDVLIVQDNKKLIFPVNENENILYYIRESELYDVLKNTHSSIGHGGRDRMIKELSIKYKNIARSVIELFLSLCEPCQQKQKGIKKGVVVKPMVFNEFNSRCQVDLIDFQSHPDGKYRFIMVYQDHLTKFVILKPLKFKRAELVAYNIIDIFTLIGAPSVLQSDNGREFANQIVSSLKDLWPELKIVHGKPRHSQSQGSVERANQDIENMLTTWMQEQNTSQWSQGLRFIQLMKNRAYHSGIKTTPYEALFGCKIKIGLNTSNLPKEIIENIETEEDLTAITESISSETVANATTVNTIELEDASSTITKIKTNNENAINLRKNATKNLEIQADKMKKLSDKKLLPVEIGSTVRVPVPDVDKGRLDARNILAVVTEVHIKNILN